MEIENQPLNDQTENESNDLSDGTIDFGNDQKAKIATTVNNSLSKGTIDFGMLSQKPVVPVDVAFDENLHSFFDNNVIRGASTYESNPNDRPGFISTLAHSFVEGTGIGETYSNLQRQIANENPLDEPVDPNWKPTDEINNFVGLRKENYPYVLNAANSQDQQRRYLQALDRQNEDDYYNSGSFAAQVVGGMVGAGLPLMSLIKVSQAFRGAEQAASVINSLSKTDLISSTIAYDAYQNSQKMSGSLENTAIDSFTDIAAGVFMTEGFKALEHGYTTSKLWETRKRIKYSYDGIEIEPVISDDGEIVAAKAVDRGNAGAAKVDEAQKFADAQFANKGLFYVPVVGKLLVKGISKVSPVVRMLNSRFPTVRGFINLASDNGIHTEGMERGIASPDNFESQFGKLQGDNIAMLNYLKGLHFERNGIDTSSKTAAKFDDIVAKWKNQGYVSEQQFSDEVDNVLLHEKPSEHAAVNQAASFLREQIDNSWRDYRKAYGLPENWLSPKTAKGYLMRVYDTDAMILHAEEWNNRLVDWFKRSDAFINEKMAPINELAESVRVADEYNLNLRKNPNSTSEEITASVRELEALQRRHKAAKENLQNELRSNEDLRIHLDDWGALSADESKKLKEILKPLNEKAKELSQQKKVVANLQKETFFPESKGKSARQKAKATENLQKAEEIRKELEDQKQILKKIQDEHDTIEEELQEKAYKKEIDPIFYQRIPESQRVKFKDPNDRLKFRDTFESEYHMKTYAKAAYDTILNQTAEDTQAQILGRLFGRHGENATKERSLLIPDEILRGSNSQDISFLNKQTGLNVVNYRNTLGRRTLLKNIYKDVSVEGDVTPLADRLLLDYKSQKAPLDLKLNKLRKAKNPDPKAIKKLEKQIVDLTKDFNRAKEDMSLSYDKMMGRSRYSKKARQYARTARSLAAATRLGSVAFSMAADLMAIPFKFGIWPAIRDGVMPMLENINGMRNTPRGEAYREGAKHAHIGITESLTSYSEQRAIGTSQPFVPMSGKIGSAAEWVSQKSYKLFLTDKIDSLLQRITASTYQSQVIDFMHQFKAGTLSKRDLDKLLKYGIQPEEWADRFLAGWKEAGSDGNGFGGYISHFSKWKDLEAANKFSDAIFRATRDTIIRRGMFDAPFALDNPWISTIFTFKGFLFAALTRNTIPLMQKPDAEKMIGVMLMLFAGSLVDPMQRISKGKEPFDETDTKEDLLWKAGDYSNWGSPFTETYEDMSLLTGSHLFPNLKGEKFANRTFAGTIGGPVLGMAEDGYKILGMVGSRNWNENDVNRAVRLIPGTQAFYLRYLSNKMVESLGLPKTAAQAQRLKGIEQ